MKCPNCDGLISGSAVACKACGHRLTQASIEKWRAERNAAAGNESEVKESPMAAKLRARFANQRSTGQPAQQENNLLQFPVPPNAPIHNQAVASSNEPAWRSRVKASVQSHRERQQDAEGLQTAELSTANTVAKAVKANAAAQLLLVESALKRIRRVPAAASPAPVAARVAASPISYPLAQSHAQALMPEAERYVEAQREREEARHMHDEPVLELDSEPLPPPRIPPAAEKLRALRTRHSTITNLAYQIDEDPLEVSFDEVPLAVENLPELALAQEEDRAQHVTTADRLRAKATLHEEKLAAEPLPEAPPVSPWYTDEEVAEVKGNVWLGQPASIPMRVLAGICDIEAAALLYLPFFGAYYTMDGALDFDDYYIMALMVIFVMFLYQLITFTLNGRTLGMAIFGLRNFDVENANQRISFKRRLKQAFGGTVGLLFPPFNFVVTRVTGFQRGFGDALAGTVTLRRVQE